MKLQKQSSPSKGGRPSKYDPKYCELIIEAGKRGESFTEFACDIDVDIDTIKEWANKHPEFSAAKKKSKAHCERWMMKLGKMGMLGRKTPEIPSFNPTIWIFWMKARFGWKEDYQPDSEDVTIEFVSE